MKEFLFWTVTIGLQLLIYFLPSTPLPKGKWIRKYTAAASTMLGDSVETKQGLSSKEEVK